MTFHRLTRPLRWRWHRFTFQRNLLQRSREQYARSNRLEL
jgi:hypothetical protein